MPTPRITTSAGLVSQQSQHGTQTSPDLVIQPVWGRIKSISEDTEDTPSGPQHLNRYVWHEVYPDRDGQWREFAIDLNKLSPPQAAVYDSVVDPDTGEIWNPAVEINGQRGVIVGSIVRLVPTRLIYSKNVAGDEHSHRAWLFSVSETKIRPFKLTADLVPVGGGLFTGDGYKTPADFTVAAEWLDEPGAVVTLRPAHTLAFAATDDFLSHGIGRGPGAHFRGTFGWAIWNPRAYAETLDDGSTGVFGEWQIITLYAETIAVVRSNDEILPGAIGQASLFWIDKNNIEPTLRNSAYDIDVFNDLDVPIPAEAKIKVYLDRNSYVWRPFGFTSIPRYARIIVDVGAGYPHPGNGSGAAPRHFFARECDYDGGGRRGAVFAVDTEINPFLHTNIAGDTVAGGNGNVVRFETLADGTNVIVSNVWDRPIWKVELESVDVTAIQQGWRLMNGTQGKHINDNINEIDLSSMFVMQIDQSNSAGDNSEDVIGVGSPFIAGGDPKPPHNQQHADGAGGAGPGFRYHGGGGRPPNPLDNDHVNHPHDEDSAGATRKNVPVDAPPWLDHVHTRTDNRPRYRVMAYLQRIDQQVP